MQKRLVRKIDLEKAISKIESHPLPKACFEQYTIPSDLAAEILYIATYIYDDIIGKTVLDLGCGTGRLAIGAAFLGARETIGIDIDKVAVKVAQRNAKKLGLEGKACWIVGDIDVVVGSFDTVLQNPPFGVQKRQADRKFIRKATELGNTIYSLHKSGKRNQGFIKRLRRRGTKLIQVPPSPFLKRFIEKQGGKIRAMYLMVMTVPWMFEFHRKRKHKFVVDLYVIER